MEKTTIFTWGYYGWGNHTPELVEAVDAVETSRGFEPPIFVDIRIRRTVRAKGFPGNAFEKLLGPTRHRWMKSLGNMFIQTAPALTSRSQTLRLRTNCSTWPWNLRAISSDFSSFAVASGPGVTAKSPAIELLSPGWYWGQRNSDLSWYGLSTTAPCLNP